MANPEHIKLLLEGVSAWNERRIESPFVPDLAGEDIWTRFRDAGRLDSNNRIPLYGINLRNANLENTDLHNGTLWSADLNDAVLSHSNLIEADFKNAKLTNAKLDSCKLYGASFDYAFLDSTDFFYAKLNGKTDFSRVEYLGNTNFAGTEPWNAVLYSDKDRTVSISPNEQIRMTSVKSVGCLLDKIGEVRDGHDGKSFVLYFRGESKCGWALRPSVMRLDCVCKEKFRRYCREGEMLRELISRRPEEFRRLSSALEEWGLAQHHKLPTRFLDVTRNPLVALFNACQTDEHLKRNGRIHFFVVPEKLIKPFSSDCVSIIANLAKLTLREQGLLLGSSKAYTKLPGDEELDNRLAKLRLYQNIQQEKPYFKERIDIRDLYRVFVVEPQRFSERIRAQSGAFLASAFHQSFEPDSILSHNSSIPVYAHYKFDIPSGCKGSIIDELRLLNVTDETLSPGLDESAKAIEKAYKNQRNDKQPNH